VIAGVRTVITFHVYRDAKAAKNLQDSAPLWCVCLVRDALCKIPCVRRDV